MPASSRRKSASKAPAKYSETEIKPVTETPTTPPNATPPSPKLTWNDYSEDFKVRVQIHNYEVNALLVDVKKVWNYSEPYIKQATNYTVKTFNQVREKLQTVN